jgi:hypothetical protein
MKPYRVTLKYIINDHTHFLSTVIPAYSKDNAISKCIEVNGISVVIKAEVIPL